MEQLRDKHFLVTGGTSGIGAATVRELGRAGARVSFVGRNCARAEALCSEVPDARFVPCDLLEPTAAERILDACAILGPLAGAANIACATPTLAALTELDDEALERGLMDELRAFTRLLRAQLRVLAALDQPSSIVNVSSVNGLGASPHAAAYSALKAAIVALSKSAALDYASRGIRVNALVPGPFDTPMLDAAISQLSGGDKLRRSAIDEQYRKLIPLGRIGRPDEAASAIAWLLSDQSRFVTGSSFIIDGGMTAFAR